MLVASRLLYLNDKLKKYIFLGVWEPKIFLCIMQYAQSQNCLTLYHCFKRPKPKLK